jgi:hypothetical protein
MSNFMTAGTEISALADKKSEILMKAGNLLAEACADRGKSGKISNNLPNDIIKLIEGFSTEDQVVILSLALSALTKSIAGEGNNVRKSSNHGNSSNYFSSRGL